MRPVFPQRKQNVAIAVLSLIAAAAFTLLHHPFWQRVPAPTLAAVLSQYTNNSAPEARFAAGATNKLVLDFTVPDAWNGNSYTADILQRAGSAATYQGQTLTSFPALGTVNGVGYKEDGTTGFQGTEAVVLDLDGDSVYTSAPDYLVDGDGSATIGAGSVSPSIDVGGPLVAMSDNIAHGKALCADNLTTPTAVRIDTNGNCGDGARNEGTYLLGTSATLTPTEATSAWVFADAVAMGGDGDGKYDDGEDIFIENVAGKLKYSASADTNVYGTAGLSAGNTLTNFAADCDGAGAGTRVCKYTGATPITAAANIYVDQGSAGGAAPNGVVDRRDDALTGLGVQNSGTAVNSTDITVVKLWSESGATPGFQSNQDVSLGTMTVNTSDAGEWRLGGLTSPVPAGGQRFYVTVDLASAPTNNRLLHFQIPTYLDIGGDGIATQNGDVGVFMGSNNDGPTDQILANAYAQVIDAAAPVLTEYIPITTPTNDNTPAYAFISTEAGTITYAGECSSSTTSAVAGRNDVTFNTLAQGAHSNCTIRVTDAAGNVSSSLAVASFTVDTTAPVIAQVTPIPAITNDDTPDYVFSSTEAGNISFTGDCSSSNDTAISGSNTATFHTLAQGLHNNCTVQVTDAAGNPSNVLSIPSFTIDTDEPILAEVTPVSTPTSDSTPNYTFASTEAGAITYGGGCASATTSAVAGNNTITYNTLADGTYGACTITVTDVAGNASTALMLSSFSVHTHPPRVLNVTSQIANGTYGAGVAIHVDVIFDEAVTVSGSPTLLMALTPANRVADYDLGSNSTTVTFDYVVQDGDASPDLDYASANALSLNGGTIRDGAGNNAVLTLPTPVAAGSLGANKNIVVDTTPVPDTMAPSVDHVFSSTPDGTYALGALITVVVDWSEHVVVTGTPQLTLNTQPNAAIVQYSGGSGSNYLSFTYTVGADQRAEGLDYASVDALSLNGGTIKDAAGNDAILTLAAPGSVASLSMNAHLTVDSVTPVVAEVTPVPAFTNDTTPNYTFSSNEPATILYSGDCSSVVTSAVSGNNTITFNALATGLHSNCTLQLRDVANNTSSVLNVSAFTIDTTVPTVNNITSSKADGLYGIGALIPIQVSFTEPVTVTGSTYLRLATGVSIAQAIYASGSGTSTLTFNYTVAAGHAATDLDYTSTSALLLNGGAIKDAAGNNANVNLPVPGAAGSLGANKNLQIHTIPPVLVEVTPVYSPTTDTTPEYTFNSTEEGTIIYGGLCSSATAAAAVGDNVITFSTLPLGAYNTCTITVTDPTGNTSAPLAVTPFTVSANRGRLYKVLQVASVNIEKYAKPDRLEKEGAEITYTYQVSNTGNIHVHGISVSDNACAPVTYAKGDMDNDGSLDLTEVWEYTCRTVLQKSTTNIATVIGLANNEAVSDTAELFVPVAEPVIPPLINLTISAVPHVLPAAGGDVTYTYRVKNTGNIHVEKVVLKDSACEPVTFVSGEDDGDLRLDPHEVWIYTCKRHVSETTVSHAEVTAVYGAISVKDEASVTVSLQEPGTDQHEGDHADMHGVERLVQLGLTLHTLVKTPLQKTVYYLGADGLAHPFPNEATYFTWYCDFSQVELIHPDLLATVGKGDAVRLAPGVKMIKLKSDPKVYVIDGHQTIHWITSEAVAKSLYGSDWNRMIVDVPTLDGFTMGADLSAPDQFDPRTARKAVVYPSDDLVVFDYTPSQPGEGLVCR